MKKDQKKHVLRRATAKFQRQEDTSHVLGTVISLIYKNIPEVMPDLLQASITTLPSYPYIISQFSNIGPVLDNMKILFKIEQEIMH